jgi:hypothetical protein
MFRFDTAGREPDVEVEAALRAVNFEVGSLWLGFRFWLGLRVRVRNRVRVRVRVRGI